MGILKIEVTRRWGWSKDNTLAAFRRHPPFVQIPKERFQTFLSLSHIICRFCSFSGTDISLFFLSVKISAAFIKNLHHQQFRAFFLRFASLPQCYNRALSFPLILLCVIAFKRTSNCGDSSTPDSFGTSCIFSPGINRLELTPTSVTFETS